MDKYKYRVFVGGYEQMADNDLRNFEKCVHEFLIKRYPHYRWLYTAQKMSDIMCCDKSGVLLIGTRPFDKSWGFIVRPAGITVKWDHSVTTDLPPRHR